MWTENSKKGSRGRANGYITSLTNLKLKKNKDQSSAELRIQYSTKLTSGNEEVGDLNVAIAHGFV